MRGRAILRRLDALGAAKPKGKDRWDKAGVIAQIVSGVLIALLGLAINRSINLAQQELATRTAVSNYVKEIVTQKEVVARGELINALDIAVPPADAVTIAMHYARTNRIRLQKTMDGAVSGDATGLERPVFDRAIQVLTRLKNAGRHTLETIRDGDTMPDREIANAILGEPIHVMARVSDIDDRGSLEVANQRVTWIEFGKDTRWLDIGTYLKTHTMNDVVLRVVNGEYGGFSGRLEISAGTEQYDSGVFARDGCPCNAPAFYTLLRLDVPTVVDRDASVKITAQDPVIFDSPSEPTSDTKAEKKSGPPRPATAAKDVLDRTMGKAPQAVDVSGPASGLIEFRWAGDAPRRTKPAEEPATPPARQLPPSQEAHPGEDAARFGIPTHLPPVPAGWRKAPPRKP
jgi:hypothetical protein